jgi:hypothetical protein
MPGPPASIDDDDDDVRQLEILVPMGHALQD